MKLLCTAVSIEEEIGNIIMPLLDPETTLRQFREHINAIATLIEKSDVFEVKNYLKNHVKQGTKEEAIFLISLLIREAFNQAE